MKSLLQRFSGQQQSYEGPLRVVPVEGRRGLRQFIRLPWSIYRDDPAWVPPLLMERRQHFSSRNPFFEHAQCKFWLAYRGAIPVGRISAQVDQLHLQQHDDATGFFGFLEAEDKAETFQALFDVDFHVRKGLITSLIGPSGCGKTTLLYLLAGLHQPQTGQVLVGGYPVPRPQGTSE